MLRCILQDFSSHPFHDRKSSYCGRRRLLLELTARRGVLRVICAPSQYGKTVLAFQYAQQVFKAENVAWVDAGELTFLLALDSPLSVEFEQTYLGSSCSQKLFVVDGCPYLNDARFAALCSLIESLIEAGHEVVITTCDTRWAHSLRIESLTVDARMLLLDTSEQDEWGSVGVRDSCEPRKEVEPFSLSVIAGFRDAGEQALDSFWKMLMNAEMHTEHDAVSLFGVLLGTGWLHELTMFAPSISTSMTSFLERHFPHCGIKRLDPMFSAPRLSDDQKFSLVQHHMGALVKILDRFEDEESLIQALVTCFLRRSESLLATQLVCGLRDEANKAAYYDRHAQTFLLEVQPLALVRLASSLPRSFCSTNGRWRTVIMALGLLGDVEHIDHAFDSLESRSLAGENASISDRSVDQSHASSAKNDELFCAVARIILEREPNLDSDALISLVRAAQLQASEQQQESQQQRFKKSLLKLIELTLSDPLKGMSALEKIASTGYSIKEGLSATVLFVQFVLCFWRERFVSGAPKPLRNPSPVNAQLKPSSQRDNDMLGKLEQHLTRMFTRQEEALAPNAYELFLFEKGQKIFGDRIYLLVSDALLQRIVQKRKSLLEQRKQWREMRLKSGSDQGGMLEEATSSLSRSKRLRINTLGRFEIEASDPTITVASKVRKQLRLLISLLAINDGREVPRPWVQHIMWPNTPEQNARQNLYSMWSLLNKSIVDESGECPFFESFPQSVALNERLVETDIRLLAGLCKRLRSDSFGLHEYEIVLDEIEDLYRGPLLPGIETAEVVAHRKKYQDNLLEALIRGGSRLQREGMTALALRYFRFAFENEPTREDVCYQLMMVLWKLGRYGEALNEYFVCRHALIDRYGIESSARLRGLYESILHDAS